MTSGLNINQGILRISFVFQFNKLVNKIGKFAIQNPVGSDANGDKV